MTFVAWDFALSKKLFVLFILGLLVLEFIREQTCLLLLGGPHGNFSSIILFIYLFQKLDSLYLTHCSEVIFQFRKQTIIESFKTRKNILIFTSEKRKLKWPLEVLINDISSSIGFAFRSFVISILKDKTIICSDNRPRQSSF